SSRLAMPASQQSGWTLSGPKKPTLPQVVTRFEPTRRPSTSAAKAAAGSVRKRLRTQSESPAKRSGSGRPTNVPKAVRKMRSASSRSLARSGRTIGSTLLEDAAGAEGRDLVRRQVQHVTQDLVGVLAQPRRGGVDVGFEIAPADGVRLGRM